MDVVSNSPLRVASAVWQPRAGAWALAVVCKATFQLQPGVSPLADQQEPPAEDDAHWGDDETGSLRLASDVVPFKARADVLVVGHAFAPGGQAVRSLPVRLAVGAIDKRLDVWCDRIFWQDGQVLEGQPFTRMPLRWEHAAGGPATANPVGMRFDAAPDAYGSVRIPNLQPAGVQVARRGDTFGPVGLGPVAPGWPGRAGKLGRHAAGFPHRRWRERPLPADLDRAYFNAAPPDQQVASIPPDERILLENLHPDHPILETRLPGQQPRALFTSGGRAGEGVALSADTLVIDTDRALVTVTWRGRVPLTHAAEAGTLVVSLEGEPQGTVAFGGEGYAGSTIGLGPGGPPAAAVLPFGSAAAGARAPAAPAAPLPAPSGELGTLAGGRAGAPALPFAAAKSPWLVFKPEPGGNKPQPAPADTGTLYGVKGKAYDVLPTTWSALQATRPAPIAEMEIDDEETPQAGEAPAPGAPAAEPVAAEPAAIALVPGGEAPEAAATGADAPDATAEPPLAEITLEQCAAIAASIARRKAEAAQILEANGLEAKAWAAHEERWSSAVAAEMTRGKTALLRAYDRAYVARLEEERGAIDPEAYARLVVATERGTIDAVLAEMTLPREAVIRIERVWLGRIMLDVKLGKDVRGAVKVARSL